MPVDDGTIPTLTFSYVKPDAKLLNFSARKYPSPESVPGAIPPSINFNSPVTLPSLIAISL